MNRKKLVVSTISLLSIILIFSACGRIGEKNLNIDPIIEITSFAGADSTEAIDETNPDVYQQRIFWNAYDTDGVVRKYAYRVMDINGNPIQTADHEVIDADGWIYHYMDGANISEEMAPGDNAEIWTNDAYALINFPAADEDGVNEVLTSIFEVKCIDDRGGESIPARKWISSESEVPRVQILSTKGVIDGQIVGTGLTFAFDLAYLSEHDYPVSDYPYYFDFMLKKIYTEDDSVQPEGYGDDNWHSTKGTDDPKHFTVTNVQTGNFQTFPSIFPNTEALADSTRLYVIGYNLAGVATEIDSVTFQVKEGLNPGSIIYNGYDFVSDEMDGAYNTIVAYGDNHFTTLEDDYGTEIPDFNTSEGVKIATPFWINKDGEFSCLGSNNLRIFMHWGWHGEFGEALQGGNTFINDKPRGESRIGQVVDEDTDTPYFSEIVFFDLRLDGEPYYYAPYPPTEDNIVTDADGVTQWLRVPYSHDIAQRTTITRDQILHNSDSFYGLHTFEVRVVDLQMEGDPSPAVMNFRIVERVPREEKSGVLIIDDDAHHFLSAPDDIIDLFYLDVFEGLGEDVDVIDRAELESTTFVSALHFQRDVLAATDLEPYKLVVYHSDYASDACNIAKEYEVMELYMRGGGNALISAGQNLTTVYETMDLEFLPLFRSYFGIPMTFEIPEDEVVFNEFSASFGSRPFFDKANMFNGFGNNIYLNLPSFNMLVTNFKGLGPISFMTQEHVPNENIILTLGCKQPDVYDDANSNGQWDEGETITEDNNQDGVGDDWDWDLEDNANAFPMETDFDNYNGKIVGIKNFTGNNNCYMFTFPLSYMKTEEVKTMMNTILNELP